MTSDELEDVVKRLRANAELADAGKLDNPAHHRALLATALKYLTGVRLCRTEHAARVLLAVADEHLQFSEEGEMLAGSATPTYAPSGRRDPAVR